MAYDEKLEKIEKEKKVALGPDLAVIGKIYTYNQGSRKFKLLFEQSKRTGSYLTNKFPALLTKAEIKTVVTLLQEFEKSF